MYGTNGGKLLRTCWKYSPATDKWTSLPDAPYHVEQGGTAVIKDRYILSLGSTHGKNRFGIQFDRRRCRCRRRRCRCRCCCCCRRCVL
jgi:hypothetical protein